MKAVIRLRDEHEFIKTIVGAWLRQNWGHALTSDITFEREFRSPKGYEFRIDVYAELKKGVPIIAEVKPFGASPDECFRFIHMCDELKPYLALFVCPNLSEGARLILEKETFMGRTRDGKEGVWKAWIVGETELKEWFDAVKPLLKLEAIGYLTVEL